MTHIRKLLSLKIFIVLFRLIIGEFNPHEYCSDMEPQQMVAIEKLAGIWYGIEIISHRVFSNKNFTSLVCPVVHIMEDTSQEYATNNPLYRNYNYDYNYANNYENNYEPNRRDYDERNPYDQPRGYTSPYYRTTTRQPNRYHDHRDYEPRTLKWKRLRLLWVELSNVVEYNLKYEVNKPGFLISSGPYNGSSLEPKFDHFAGTIQVLKAVGSHLVLTFCFRLPEPQLFTLVLARSHRLELTDVNGVHNLLMRRRLDIARRHDCSRSDAVSLPAKFTVLLLLTSVIPLFYVRGM